MKEYKKHLPGETNFLTFEEENEILSALRKAKLSSSNSAIYGQNGEIPLRNYLKKHLPSMFRVETGHFVTKEGIKLLPAHYRGELGKDYGAQSMNDNKTISL